MRQFDIALSFATENQLLVEDVYEYLKAEGLYVFFAPSPEGQALISGKNQRQIFYQIFGLEAKYVALFVSKDYINKKIPMEEARISLKKRAGNNTVIPIYLDHAKLPVELFDPKRNNYYSANNAIDIAVHLAARCKSSVHPSPASTESQPVGEMRVSGNLANKQIIVNTNHGVLNL